MIKNLKVYNVINCLNKNLITHLVCILRKKRGLTLKLIDRVLNKEYFLWKNHVENVPQNLVLDPFLVLVNHPQQPLHAQNSFKNKIL